MISKKMWNFLNTPVRDIIDKGLEKIVEISKNENPVRASICYDNLPVFASDENGLTEKAEGAFERILGYEKADRKDFMLSHRLSNKILKSIKDHMPRIAPYAIPVVKTAGYLFVGSLAFALSGCGGSSGGSSNTNQQITDITNHAPIITSMPNLEAEANSWYVYNFDAFDADNDSLTYHLEQAPSDMMIDSRDGLIKWLPQQTGQNNVKVCVNDGVNNDVCQEYAINVAQNLAPTITSLPATNGEVSSLYEYQVVAVDDGDPLAFSLAASPSGMIIDPATGLISWTPQQSGQENVKACVNDGINSNVCQEYTINVVPFDNPPVINTASLPNGVAGKFYNTTINASDPDSPILAFSLAQSPEGMSIDSNTGEINWSPRYSTIGPKFSQTGNFIVTVQVSDGTKTAEKGLSLVVEDNLNAYGADFMKTDDGNISVRCGTDFYPCPFIENYLDLKFVGTSNAVKNLKNKSGTDVKTTDLDPNPTPAEVHMTEYGIGNDVCQQQSGEWAYQALVQRPDNIGRTIMICTFKYKNPDGSAFDAAGTAPDDLYSQWVETHENFHSLNWLRIPQGPFSPAEARIFDESFAYAVSSIVTQCQDPYIPKQNATPVNSFCDLPLEYNSNGNHSLPTRLCQQNGFDVSDLPALFAGIDQKLIETGYINNLPIPDVKCILDNIVLQNTYQAFADSGIVIVNPGYCGN